LPLFEGEVDGFTYELELSPTFYDFEGVVEELNLVD
jgi:hypothetical protein